MKLTPTKIFITGLCFFTLSIVAQAQVESDERPMLKVEDGLGFQKDSVFLVNMRFRMQNRAGYFSTLEGSEEPGFDARVRRLRLRFDGYMFTRKLAYYIQLSFSRSDQDIIPDLAPNIVRDAMVYYYFTESFYMGFGQSKLPGNRQRVISSGNIQMPDRSIANALYTIDRDFGLFFYKNLSLGKPKLSLKGAVSSGEGRYAEFSNNGLAYTGRIEFLPLGAFKNLGDYSEGDLEFEPKPKVSIAATYSYNHKAVRRGGQLGDFMSEPLNMSTFIADMMFKWQGWALLGEYFYREIDGYSTDLDVRLSQLRAPAGNAYNIQLSKMISKKDEIIVRQAGNAPFEHLQSYQASYLNRAVGYGRYWNGHRIKAQAFLGLDDRTATDIQFGYENRWVLMFQMEFGI